MKASLISSILSKESEGLHSLETTPAEMEAGEQYLQTLSEAELIQMLAKYTEAWNPHRPTQERKEPTQKQGQTKALQCITKQKPTKES